MACRISEVVLGCRDPEVLARFWCEVLDFVVLDREDDATLEIGPRKGFGGPQPVECAWLRQHANAFGFCESWLEGNDYGMRAEPWHWQYLGAGGQGLACEA